MFGIFNLGFFIILWGAGLFVLYLIIKLAVRHGIDSSEVGRKLLKDDSKLKDE